MVAPEDPEALTEAQLEELRRDLIALTDELTRQLSDSEASAATVAIEQPIGRLSRMDAIAQQHVALAGRKSARRRLRQVQAALQRIEDGEYGYCLHTGEPIGYRRLKVRPEAALSVAGQAALERRARSR